MRLILAAVFVVLFPALALGQMQPGQWELQVTVTSFDIPNAPPQATEALKKPRLVRRCVTPAEAAAGPLHMMKTGASCVFTRESLNPGKFEVVMTCTGEERTTTARISGSFGATQLDMNADIDQTGPQAMKMTTVTAAKRVGDCP